MPLAEFATYATIDISAVNIYFRFFKAAHYIKTLKKIKFHSSYSKVYLSWKIYNKKIRMRYNIAIMLEDLMLCMCIDFNVIYFV